MDDDASQKLLEEATEVLKTNDRGDYTVPASDLYPHQWLWDSSFIAIGLRHLNVERAQAELTSLLRGQWANGMLPHIIFADGKNYRDRRHEEAWINPHAPNGVITSGITQPPMLAEAVVAVGQKLKLLDRRSWYSQMYPHLLAYHQWLYGERALDNGLIGLVHPYESGLDNSPAWVLAMREQARPWWLKLTLKMKFDTVISSLRRDTKHVPRGQRETNAEGLASWALMLHLRHQGYNSAEIFRKPKLIVEDLAFNCILLRANQRLAAIAKTIGKSLPQELIDNIQASEDGLEQLWDETSGQYYSYSFGDGGLIHESSIATLLPLYSGCVSKERAEHLVDLMKKRGEFRVNWPVPSVPLSSSFFDPARYWQGPSWVNTNWLIVSGLELYGFEKEATELKENTLKMVAKSGCYEYFSPINAAPAGASNFSWTAALTIDLLKNS